VELVVAFAEDSTLRNAIVVHNNAIAEHDEQVRLEEISEIHRYRDAPLYSQVHLMDYEVFKSHGSYPCFTEPVTASMHHEEKLRFRFTTPADEINFETAYVIFISHTWFKREADGELAPIHTATDLGQNAAQLKISIPFQNEARDLHVNTHPDTTHNEQYKLCVTGLHKFVDAHLTNFDKVYIWMDYCCLDLRPEHIETTLSKLSLTSVMACCDCLFTPVLDYNLDWDYPAEIEHFYEDYNPAPWRVGPAAYMNRAWCRMEMFYAYNVPLMPDLTPEDVAAYTTRFHSVLVETEREKESKNAALAHLTDPNVLLSDHKFVHRNPFANLSASVLESKLSSRRMRMSKRLRIRASR
jgi:hypothetical protein